MAIKNGNDILELIKFIMAERFDEIPFCSAETFLPLKERKKMVLDVKRY